MRQNFLIFLFVFHVGFANCGYPPMGDEVQSGSVLLPASRRGRYLANIARRQAVDGTGIKFHEHADRMNAEAKKKVDVLSEELLPYIIAEQERRTTLYKRVMTAIQNGEKGVTIAEIRNKPPAIIRKGLTYRCPINRAPREPDGSGTIMCEGNLDPTPILFESCLSAEERELYVADNKYFFCNRHKIEGPDLPRNGTSVIGCAPSERTSLNYTSQKCALEDADDVVVHYRYYPDRTYKFVSELDPDREVCEHWNPCQVGYIFSLPGPDQATPATELWHDYTVDTDEEISREEIVPPIPEDNKNETTFLGLNYVTSTRRVLIPKGYEYHGVGKYLPNGLRTRVSRRDGALDNFDNIEVISEEVGVYIKITMIFHPMRAEDATTYYVRFEEIAKTGKFIHIPLVTLSMGQTRFTPQVLVWLPPQKVKTTSINYTCTDCELTGIMLRGADGSERNVDVDKYRLRKFSDNKGVEQSVINLDKKLITTRNYGDFFLMIKNDECREEQIKALTLIAPAIAHNDLIQMNRLHASLSSSPRYENVTYTCADCEITDVQCHGKSVLSDGLFQINPVSKTIIVYISKIACVYMGMFKIGDDIYRKIVAIISNTLPAINITDARDEAILLPPPAEGTPFEHKIYYSCYKECSFLQVNVNGIPLETITRRSNVGSVAYYLPENRAVTIGFTEYDSLYEGMYQGLFKINEIYFTKNLMEIGPKENREGEFMPLAAEFSNLFEEVTEETEETMLTPESLNNAALEARNHQSPGSRRSEGKTEQSCTVYVLRDSLPAGRAYKQKTVGYTCPGGQLVAVSCRGQIVTTGVVISGNNTVNIDFDHFEDTNACVYMGIFKINQTEQRKTLAVLENSSPMIDVTMSAVVPPPPSGQFKHKVLYTCNVANCAPAKIYINDKTLKSDDKNPFYSYKSEMVKGNDKEVKVMTVIINFSIKPFTKEYEGVYQLVVTNGTERVTKNIMEIGALV